MKKLFLLLALLGVLAVGCEERFPTEQSPNATPVFSTDGESSYIVDAEGEEIAVMVTTNIDYSVVIPEDAEEWLSVADTRALRVDTLTFIVAPNDTTVERTTIVKFVDDNNNILQTISFTQNAAVQSEPVCPNNEIWYTNGSTTEATTPNKTNVFGANIVSNTYSEDSERWVIKFDGDVTTIGDNAFDDCRSLTSVTIPDSVTTIGDEAFYDCRSLTSVTIPDSVTTIGDEAFCWCGSLTSVTIPDSVTTIGEWAFSDCYSLQEFNGKFVSEDGRCLIIDGVLNSFAPAGLTEYTIPDSVTTIGKGAFNDCYSLTSVTIPDSVTLIGMGAFSGCSSLQEFNGKFASEDGRCLIIDGVLNYFAPAGLTEYTIPHSVITIGDDAFAFCYYLISVTIPDSVTTIGEHAFSRCESLTSVYCKPTTPPAGGSSMFYYNASGRKIYVPVESVEAYKSASYWSDYADDIVGYDFENGVAGTPKPANNEIWYTNGSTTEATTPYITNVFGANIVSNTYDAVKECWVIKFDGDVTWIGSFAFYECSSLTSVTIPDSVTWIGENAFQGCRSLHEFKGKFASEDGRCLIVDGVLKSFAPAGLTEYTILNSVTRIGDHAFYYCYSLTSVTIPDSVTKIGECAFFCCFSLTSVTIPDSVTKIGEYAFIYCDSLQEFNGKFASEDGRCLIVDGTLISFAPAGLTEYTIPDSVTTIGNGAFYYCYSLTSVTIPVSVTKIGCYAFANCSSLTSIYCKPATQPSITVDHNGYWDAFDYNASGRKIYVPMESVEAYKSASYWSNYASDIVGYDF